MKLLVVTKKKGEYYFWLSDMGLQETRVIMMHSKYHDPNYHEEKDWMSKNSNQVSVFAIPYIYPSKYWKLKHKSKNKTVYLESLE